MNMEENKPSKENKRNVMIAMDGSKHAIHAFKWYADNMYRPTDNVIMAHSAEQTYSLPPPALMGGNEGAIQKIIQQYEEDVMKVFRTIDDLASKHNIKHTLERLNGYPGETIVKAAEQQNVDLIIAGSRGLGTIRRTIMGSTSDYILHHARVPVLICKHEDERQRLK